MTDSIATRSSKLPRALVYSQHLYGIGHLTRSTTLAEALARDFEVLFVNGGEPVERLTPTCLIVSLPPVRMYEVPPRMRPVDPSRDLDDVLLERKGILLDLLDTFQPNLVLIESYPFGRAALGPELIPFLTSCRHSRVPVLCSVRDILVPRTSQQDYDRVVAQLLNEYFDAILVHGDPRVSRLADSFSATASIQIPIHHTGYVVRPPTRCTSECEHCAPPSASSPPDIIVSVGGGRSGTPLLLGAIDAASSLRTHLPHSFILFSGPFTPPEDRSAMTRAASQASNISLAAFTPCLISRLATCALSISMGGYNTVLEVLRNSRRALVWPHGERANADQQLRCDALAPLGLIQVLARTDITGSRFAQAILAALDRPLPSCKLNFEGAETTRAIATQLVDRTSAVS